MRTASLPYFAVPTGAHPKLHGKNILNLNHIRASTISQRRAVVKIVAKVSSRFNMVIRGKVRLLDF
jgi:hypothetical protein